MICSWVLSILAPESDSNLVVCQKRGALLQILHFKSINLPFQNLFNVSYMINNIPTVLLHQLMCPCMHVHHFMVWYLFLHQLLLTTMPQVTQVASVACVRNTFEQLHPGNKVPLITTVPSSTLSLSLMASTDLVSFASCYSSHCLQWQDLSMCTCTLVFLYRWGMWWRYRYVDGLAKGGG